VNSIHIRYEDTITNPQHPMAAGITLDSIQMQVTCVCMCVCVCVCVCVCACVCEMSNCCLCLLMGVVQVGLWVPTPSPLDMVQPCLQVLALLQVHWLSFARIVSRHLSASLSQCDRLAAARDCFFLLL